jgi:Outer membrane protein beta-barrel domain
MKKLIALAIVAIASHAVLASAGEEAVASSKEVAAPPPPLPTSYFRSNELSLGAFGSYGVGFYDNHRAIGNHAWGGGVDAQYFPLQPYLGVSVEGDFFNEVPRDNFGATVTGNAILRYPLDLKFPGLHLAPYVFGGVGGIFNDSNAFTRSATFGASVSHSGHKDEVLGDTGGGLEYRFTPHIGLFTDARYNFVNGTRNDFMLSRVGVRFAF